VNIYFLLSLSRHPAKGTYHANYQQLFHIIYKLKNFQLKN